MLDGDKKILMTITLNLLYCSK